MSYLIHYGVKDQKHGVRRYQNKDGSLTALGRIHYGVGQARTKLSSVIGGKSSKNKSPVNTKETSSRIVSADKNESSKKISNSEQSAKKIKTVKERRLSELTNDEVRSKIERLNLENQYIDAYKKRYPDKQHKVRQYVAKLSANLLSKYISGRFNAYMEDQYGKGGFKRNSPIQNQQKNAPQNPVQTQNQQKNAPQNPVQTQDQQKNAPQNPVQTQQETAFKKVTSNYNLGNVRIPTYQKSDGTSASDSARWFSKYNTLPKKYKKQ